MLCSLQASQFYTAIYLRGVLLYLIKDIFNEKLKKTLSNDINEWLGTKKKMRRNHSHMLSTYFNKI